MPAAIALNAATAKQPTRVKLGERDSGICSPNAKDRRTGAERGDNQGHRHQIDRCLRCEAEGRKVVTVAVTVEFSQAHVSVPHPLSEHAGRDHRSHAERVRPAVQ